MLTRAFRSNTDSITGRLWSFENEADGAGTIADSKGMGSSRWTDGIGRAGYCSV